MYHSNDCILFYRAALQIKLKQKGKHYQRVLLIDDNNKQKTKNLNKLGPIRRKKEFYQVFTL